MKKIFCALLLALAVASAAQAGERARFRHFSAILPAGWDGAEQTAFISNDPLEYQLTLGKKDESGDNFAAQVSIFLLPNRPGADSETAARILAESQADASAPGRAGEFWIFDGEPRTRAITGRGRTMVRTIPERMLIIIAQDPLNLGADGIIASLRGETDEAAQLLGK